MAGLDVKARWQAQMAPFFENLGPRRPDEGFLRLEETRFSSDFLDFLDF